MEKKLINVISNDQGMVHKFWLTMRLIVFLFFVSLVHVSASVYSQKTKLNLRLENVTLQQAIKAIQDQSEFDFFYKNEQLPAEARISVDYGNESIELILKDILNGTGLGYHIIDKDIVISTNDFTGENTQQQKTLKGKVTDSSGVPLPGVSVVVKGTTTGVITDNNGNYSLANISENATLQFSFVGMKMQEVIFGKKNTINVVMEEETIGLEEVVAIAYGTKKRKDLLGSVGIINSAEIGEKSTGNLADALQGLSAGLQVTSQSATPGGAPQVKIRGINSISSGSEPLWVVDGVPVMSSSASGGLSTLSMFNPNDIENVSVLKDAGATAIYGSRASNGVILITTKSGKSGKSSFDIDLKTGFSDFTKTNIGLADGPTYMKIMDEASMNSNGTLFDPSVTAFSNGKKVNREDALKTNSDYLKAVIRTGTYKDLNVSISKGGEDFTSFLSVNYRDEKGVMKANDLKRFSARMNANYTPVKILKFALRSSNSFAINQGLNNQAFKEVMSTNPIRPIYDATDGTGLFSPKAFNPLRWNRRDLAVNDGFVFRSGGNLSAELTIPFIQGLSLKGSAGYDLITDRGVSWTSLLLNSGNSSSGSEAVTNFYSFTANTSLNYEKKIGVNEFSVVAGFETQKDLNHFLIVSGTNTAGTWPEVGDIGKDNLNQARGNITDENYFAGYFGRLSYKLKNRYLVEGSIRRDGSSKFVSESRWGNFSSVSAGWIVSEEEFFKNPVVNLLKLRGSYGKTGNSNIPSTASFTNRYYQSALYANQQSTAVGGIGNSLARWESSNNLELGVDFGILQNKITGSAAYYSKDVFDLLLSVPLPPSTGLDGGNNSIWQNIGELKTSGLEFELNANIISRQDFKWNISANFSTSKNKVAALYPDVDKSGTGIINQYTITKTGESIGTYYIPEFGGIDPQKGISTIYERDANIYKTTGQTQTTGKKIPETNNNYNNNKMILSGKSGAPKWFGGFGSTVTYKIFDLGFNFVISGGNYLLVQENAIGKNPYDGGGQLQANLLTDSWKKPGDIAKYPQLNWNYAFKYDDSGNPIESGNTYNRNGNSGDLQKGDYIRLRNLTLGCNIPANLISKWGIHGIRITLTGTNLLTFTKFKGYDPELAFDNADPSQGIRVSDYSMPQTKTYSLGVSFKF